MARYFSAVIVSLLVFAGFASPALANPPADTPGQGSEFVPGEVLVGFYPGTPGDEMSQAVNQAGGEIIDSIPGIEVKVVRVPAGQEAARIQALQNNPNVEFAEVNGLWSDGWTPDDTSFGDQWQYNNVSQTGGTTDADIDAVEAWTATQNNPIVLVAVLDTGIDPLHPDLGSKVVASVNFTDSTTTDDIRGHGTHVAGSVAAITNNAAGVAGTCPDCVLLNVKVLGDTGSGSWDGVAKGIDWAANNNARVINMSLGGGASRTVERAVNNAWNKGVVIVAAAGNNGSSTKHYPAAYSNVIAVASTDHNDSRSSFSNYGDWVSVAAPGSSILSTTVGGGYGYKSGTSMATPHVAGLAGLVWTIGATSNVDVRSRIEKSADKITGTGSLWVNGRVNACAAVGGVCDVPTFPPTATIINPVHNTEVTDKVITVKAEDESDAHGELTVAVSINNGGWQSLSPSTTTENLYELNPWDTSVLHGAYTIVAKATDSAGNTTFSEKVIALVLPPVMLPGIIEAENYRAGENGTAYLDSSTGNTGGTYRDDDVDIQACADSTTPADQTCYNVGWVTNGEWLTYDVSVSETATFQVTARVASEANDTFLHIFIGDKDVSGPIAVPNTTNWQKWADVTSPAFEIPTGNHVIKLVAKNEAGGYLFNLNYVKVNLADNTVEPAPEPTGGLSVVSLEGSADKHGRNWQATATTVVHGDGVAVANATVHGTWSNAPSTVVTCQTDSAGTCSVPSAMLSNQTPSVSFTLTSVTREGYDELVVNQTITIQKPS